MSNPPSPFMKYIQRIKKAIGEIESNLPSDAIPDKVVRGLNSLKATIREAEREYGNSPPDHPEKIR